jgi:uncharacterized protein
MRYRRCGTACLIRLEIGEEIIPTLSAFIRKKGIMSGWLQGIGAVDHVTIGGYDIKHRKYHKKTLEGDQELLSMTGNIAWLDKDPALHIHATFSDLNHHLSGGHLFEARVCVTVEVLLVPWSTRVKRQADEETALNLLALGAPRR